jgi:hypothetical protein
VLELGEDGFDVCGVCGSGSSRAGRAPAARAMTFPAVVGGDGDVDFEISLGVAHRADDAVDYGADAGVAVEHLFEDGAESIDDAVFDFEFAM